MRFKQLKSEDKEACKVFDSLMREYVKELDAHDGGDTSAILDKWIESIIRMQGDSDRHLELCYIGDDLIGFLYEKVDHPEHRGYKKIGYGYIMEFYVKPEYRRCGYGRTMFERLQKLFRLDGADRMYLTSDPVTGKPFWESMGFARTGEISPENSMEIYEKDTE